MSRTKGSGGDSRFYADHGEGGPAAGWLSQRVALYPRVVKQLVKRAAEMRSVSSGSVPGYLRGESMADPVKKTLKRGTNPSYDAKLCTNRRATKIYAKCRRHNDGSSDADR